MSKITWAKKFLEAQNHKNKSNIIFQDNQSAIKLMKNGRESSGECTCHFEIRFFYATGMIGHRDRTVEYHLTNKMIIDYMSKLLVK